MAELHFLRPLWLWLLPLMVFFAWRFATGRGGQGGWRAVVDKPLQPFVLREGEGMRQRRWPLLAALLAAFLGVLALAGPAWERVSVPAYRSAEALVVALDLSRSMDATDVAPSRLTRARIKLLDLLGLREGGQTALVVFSSHAFTVTPLTTDNKTISSLVNSLSTDIMPSQGSLIEAGLSKSAGLLRQAGASDGEILLITDAVASPEAIELAASFRAEGIRTSVLAVGTEQGAPVPTLGGGFLTDSRGDVVIPQLNFANLERLAASGGGRFAGLSIDDRDLNTLYPEDTAGRVVADAEGDDAREADIWLDNGPWLAVALLPLLALGFRRGWVYMVIGGLLLPVPDAKALDWTDLWLRRDQQGERAMLREEPDAAAELFEDPEWLAAARYRAGQFETSAAALAGLDAPDAHYNRGNALARNGQLAEAIDAYDRALELEPEHEDALFNRELVAELLEQQQQQQQENENQDSEAEGQSQEQEQSAGENADGDGQGEQQTADNQQEEQGTDQGAAPQEDEASDQEMADNENPEEGSDQQALQAAARPEDIEDWADEQAADQWLRRVPQDPGGLLRRKFLYQYQQQGLDQDGNRIWPGSEAEPW